MRKVNKIQTSYSFITGLFLSFAGGLIDGASYLTRGNVFTYAVTGNLIFLATSLSKADLNKAISYLIPIIAFNLGVFFATAMKGFLTKSSKKFHWRQLILIIEIAFIVVSSLIPYGRLNYLSNILIAFITASQTNSFRKFHDNLYLSTMCTGNMRSAAFHLQRYFINRDKGALTKSLAYYLLIAAFFLGALASAILQVFLGVKTILMAIIPLSIVIYRMDKEEVEI